jgi:hypothetical protein
MEVSAWIQTKAIHTECTKHGHFRVCEAVGLVPRRDLGLVFQDHRCLPVIFGPGGRGRP